MNNLPLNHYIWISNRKLHKVYFRGEYFGGLFYFDIIISSQKSCKERNSIFPLHLVIFVLSSLCLSSFSVIFLLPFENKLEKLFPLSLNISVGILKIKDTYVNTVQLSNLTLIKLLSIVSISNSVCFPRNVLFSYHLPSPLGWGSNPGSCITLHDNCHDLLVSLNIEKFLNLSLWFLILTFLKSTGHLFCKMSLILGL